MQNTVRSNKEKLETFHEQFEDFENNIIIRVDSLEEKLSKTTNDTDLNKIDL